MWYRGEHESTSVYPPARRRRAPPHPSGLALLRCLCLTPLPDSLGQCPRRTRTDHWPAAGLQRPDRAQRAQRVQCPGSGGPAGRVVAAPSATHRLLGGERRAAGRAAAPLPAGVWPRADVLDLGDRRPGQLRARPDCGADLDRKRAASPAAPGQELAPSQALDHQPRSAVRRKKRPESA